MRISFFPISFLLTLPLLLPASADTISLHPTGIPVIQPVIENLTEDDGFTIIKLAPGTYREQLTVSAQNPPIKIVGTEGKTRIVYDATAKTLGPSGEPIGTFESATITIESDDFTAEGITFENDHGPGVQAVALSIGGDRGIFRNCRFLGWQDTLLVRRERQYFDRCYITGSVDYIFGDATAYFHQCHLHSRDSGYLTAASTSDRNEFGFVFSRCKITSEPECKIYLGRPWRPHASVHFLSCNLPDTIRPEGWHNWRKPESEKTTRYYEWHNTGPGADTGRRVNWLRPLADAQGRGLQRPWRILRKWDPNAVLSQERVASLPTTEQEAWQKYLSHSLKERARARRRLKDELAEENLIHPRRPADGGKPPASDHEPDWFRSETAHRLAKTILSFQTPAGAWSKNLDYRKGERARGTHWSAQGSGDFPWHYVGTLDNEATTKEIRFLARYHQETSHHASASAVRRGIDFLLDSQYPNGGWPQVWPLQGGYHDQITLNDDAMIHALELLADIAEKKEPFDFVDRQRRQRAKQAVSHGIECLLNAQIVIDGKATIWCAQHDPLTLRPSGARMQEPASLSSYESASVVGFLTEHQHWNARIHPSIQAARKWYSDNAVTGIIRSREGKNLLYEEGSESKELWWGRFHELETQKPIFPGAQCGGIHLTFKELAVHNTTAYQYYCDRPRSLLKDD